MFRIKTATILDIPVIQDLTQKIWRPTYQSILTPAQIQYMIDWMYSTSSLLHQMTVLQHCFIILLEEEMPTGFAAYSTTATAGIYKLQKIYLDPNHHGKGVGKFLLAEVTDRVKALGANILELDVNRFNKARFFYEKQGFVIVKEKNTDIGHGYLMEDFVMRKKL